MTIPLTLTSADAAIERHYERDPQTRERIADPIVDGLAAAAKMARLNGETLSELIAATAGDKTSTPAAAALQLRNGALKLGEAVAKKLDAAQTRAMDAITEITSKVSRPEPLSNPHLSSEIRSRISALPERERQDAIAAALNSDDQTVAAAVLNAPAFLSGMSPAEFEMRRHQWQSRKYPAETQRIERLTKAVADLERVGKAYVAYTQAAATTPAAELAEAMAKRAEAARAAVQAAGDDE